MTARRGEFDGTPGIVVRDGPEGSGDLEGAFEDGKYLVVIGKKLKEGDDAPDFLLYRINIESGTADPVALEDLPEAFLFYTVNSFFTPVCEAEATTECNSLALQLHQQADGIVLYGVTNDSIEDNGSVQRLTDWMSTNKINHQILVARESSSFGRDYGVYLPDPGYDGQLQRGLFGVVRGKIVYAEYVYDQGGPLPHFDQGTAAVRQALAA